jgi:AraC-like DNA-binding protein
MVHIVQHDIVHLIKHICLSLDSYALDRQLEIIFTTTEAETIFDFQPLPVINGLSQILCGVMSYLSPCDKVRVSTSIINATGLVTFQVSITNTGINLSTANEITNNIQLPVSVQESAAKETTFVVQVPISSIGETANANKPTKLNDENFPVFFEEVRKRLQSYFSRTNNYLENLNEINPKKALFLKKINECILQNLDNEDFDATALSKGMAMSRTQLFRKLKPIISQPPAAYIRGIRLQKAKELLEASDLSVSEVAYKTGFKTPSHFTKVFTEKFGIRPSALTATKAQVTNE